MFIFTSVQGAQAWLYYILLSKHPRALEIHDQNTGVGAYTDKPVGSLNKGGGRLLERIRYFSVPTIHLHHIELGI